MQDEGVRNINNGGIIITAAAKVVQVVGVEAVVDVEVFLEAVAVTVHAIILKEVADVGSKVVASQLGLIFIVITDKKIITDLFVCKISSCNKMYISHVYTI